MTLLAYRPLTRGRATAEDEREPGDDNPGPLDWALAALALVARLYPLLVFDDFARRVVRPTGLDVVLGVVAVLLVLEATRRTVGWVLPAICLGFVAYAMLGGLLPFGWELGHKGYDLERLVGQAYMGIEGLFGVSLDVAATYIVLFTIYGAVLEYSGGGPVLHRRQLRRLRDPVGGRPRPHRHPGRVPARYRVGVGGGDHRHPWVGGLAGAAPGRLPAQPGRRDPVRGRDRGHPVPAHPRRGRLHHRRVPGDLLSPGAAVRHHPDAAVLPGHHPGHRDGQPPLRHQRRRRRDQAAGLAAAALRLLLQLADLIVVFMAVGLSPFRAVLYATVVAFALGFLRRETRWTPRRLFDCLAAGTLGVLPVVAVCAAAGVIVAVVSLTGLGLKGSSLIVGAAGGTLVLAAVYSAVAVLLLGLAVPVTASFIISAVILGPALIELGVGEEAAYMFIFYYAVLSEVSPPTALSSVAAAAITGGDAFKTMLLTLRYTLPAFLVPFAFVLSPHGEGLLLQGRSLVSPGPWPCRGSPWPPWPW